MDAARRFQILSLDGGGIKGLFSAAILAKIEVGLGGRVADHFDLITGTSTGGIIALGLGAGKSPEEIVRFYSTYGRKIFRKTPLWSSIKHWFRNKYPQEPLKDALLNSFQGLLLEQSKKNLVIPSFNLAKNEVYVFKTPHHPKITFDGRVPMWKVALATSAAPTFFPCCQHVDGKRLIDGGIWANNPAMVGIVEAVSSFNVPLDCISVLSIGTTYSTCLKSKRLDKGGFIQWRTEGLTSAMAGQSHGVQGQASLLLGRDRVTRLDPFVPDRLFELDKLNEEELLAEAAHESRKFTPTFKEKFSEHRCQSVSFYPRPII